MTQRRLARPSLGGLMATRQGALMLALICAVAAAGILVFALGRYKQNVQTVTPQATVLISTAEIKPGTSGDAIASKDLVRSTPILATQLSPGAVSDTSELAGKTTQADILPGQQVTQADFAATSGVTGLLAPNQRAVSIAIDEAHGDTDAILPGERVDVYSNFSDHGVAEVVLVAENVLVIKPGSALPATAGGKIITGGAMVLAVTSFQAAEIGLALDDGKIYLALRSPNATKTPIVPTTIGSVVAAASTVVPTTAGNSNAQVTPNPKTTTSPPTTTTPTTASTSNTTGTPK